MGFSNSGAVLIFALVHMLISLSNGSVILIGKNITRTFTDIEASFTPRIKGSGINGVLYLAEPLDACSPIISAPVEGTHLPFVLIVRGECTFEQKVRNAQDAGFKAAVVYDDRDSGVLVSMAGSSRGVSIHAVFVSKASGEVLKEYAGNDDIDLWIIPSYRNSAWSIMALSIISLLTMSAIMAACFFVRRHRIRREQPRALHVREFRGMSSQLVKAMPSLNFTAVTEDNCTSATCAICLEDYSVGDKLRILPCSHKFHASCVDSWLTAWRSFCPVCKRDASATVGSPPASEHTPLLSCPSPGTRQSSFSSSSATSTSSLVRRQSSVSSSLATSTPIDVVNLSRTPLVNLSQSASINLSPSPSINLSRSPSINSSRSPSIHLSGSLSSSLRQISCNSTNTLSLCRSFTNFHPMSRSHSDLRNISSSSRSHISNLTSTSPVAHFSLPISSRHLHGHLPRPSNSSPSNPVGSSSRPSHLRRSSDSVTTISALTSTDSLPEC